MNSVKQRSLTIQNPFTLLAYYLRLIPIVFYNLLRGLEVIIITMTHNVCMYCYLCGIPHTVVAIPLVTIPTLLLYKIA